METSKTKIWLIAIGIIASQVVFSQNVSISEDAMYTPHASAMLDVYSQDKGLLVPRLTTTERLAIGSPAAGLLVYDTTVGVFYYYNGTSWAKVGSASYSYENGLTETTNIVKLGGSLTGSTTITQSTYNMIFNLNSTGDFDIQDNGVSALFVRDDGFVGIGTNAPLHKLHVYGINSVTDGTDGNLVDIQNLNSNVGAMSGLRFRNYSSFKGGIFYRTTSTYGRGDLLFANNSSTTGNVTANDVKMIIKNEGNIGIGTSTPNTSAVVDITSTDKGVLVPRMDSVHRGDIVSPANGLLVYDTDYNSFFYYNSNRSKWQNLGSKNSGTFSNEALFAVLNTNGDTVFAVYEEGVHINVGDGLSKASRGGFAVAGIGSSSKSTNQLFHVSGDSVRIYVDESTGKASRGGFAVAGVGSSSKGISTNEILHVSSDSVRVYINDGPTKASRGGFAVAGVGSSSKGTYTNNYMMVSDDSIRMYIDNTSTKASRGGFAVAGVGSSSKAGTSSDIMMVNKDSTRVYIGNENAGFGVENSSGGSSERLMKLTKENYFIGHRSGVKTKPGTGEDGRYNSFIGFETGFLNTIGSGNVFLGYQSGNKNVNGHRNVFIGKFSGLNNTSGFDNVLLGHMAGLNNTEGSYNVMIGERAGQANTSGEKNVFLGNTAGYSTTIGDDNIMLGFEAGYSNINGAGNVYIGKESGRSDTDGTDNVYIGRRAGYSNMIGTRNVFIGSQAGQTCNASENTYIGYQAGINASGHYNTLIGTNAGYNRVAGNTSVLIGTEAGYYQQGSDNTIIGSYAGRGASSKTGVKNVFIGYSAGYWENGSNKLYIESCDNNTTDSNNPLIYGDFQLNQVVINNALAINTNKTAPTEALDVTGNGKFSGTVTGSFSGTLSGNVNTGYAGYTGYSATGPRFQYFSTTAMFYGDGILVEDGTYVGTAYNGPRLIFDNTNTDISIADCKVGIGTTTPSTAFHVNHPSGYTNGFSISNANDADRWHFYVYTTNDLVLHLNNAERGSFNATTGVYSSISDLRFKKNIEFSQNVLSKLMKLNIVEYQFINQTNNNKHLGLIAQDVEPIFPHLVTHNGITENSKSEPDFYTLDYSGLGTIAIKAIQEQQAQIEALQNQVNELLKVVETLKNK